MLNVPAAVAVGVVFVVSGYPPLNNIVDVVVPEIVTAAALFYNVMLKK